MNRDSFHSSGHRSCLLRQSEHKLNNPGLEPTILRSPQGAKWPSRSTLAYPDAIPWAYQHHCGIRWHRENSTVMSSPCPCVAGSVKKVAGLLPRGEWAVCTEGQERKALYKRPLYSGPLLPIPGDMLPSKSDFGNTSLPRLATEAVWYDSRC